MDNNENLIINFSFAVLIVGGEKIDYEIEQSSISEDSVSDHSLIDILILS